jgi:hypothetical protein
VLQYAQIVIGVALPLFFTVTTLVLALVIAMALAHLATGYWDVAYTDGRRYISPPEQHVHSYMEVLPLVATALLVVLHWPAFVAIFDGTAASWAIHLRPQMAPAGVIAYVASGLVLAGAAIAEEYVRCIRHRRVAGSSA